LFAAGECASTGLHGANRLGSNSLVETLVLGRAVGAAAAKWVEETCALAGVPADDAETALIERATALARGWLAMRGRGTEPPAQLRRELGSILDADVSIFRDDEGLARASSALDGLAERYADVRVADTSDVMNTDWAAALELGAMLTIARGVVAAALARQESRGAHQRLDFPEAAAIPTHSMTTMCDGEIDVFFVAAPQQGFGMGGDAI
jgi:fumarate reductase flavoprotein subunit